MTKYIVLLLLVGSIVAGCNQAEEAVDSDGPSAESELLAADRAFAQLSADSGAVKAFGMFLSPDAVQMPAGAAPIIGRDSILLAMSSGPEFTLVWDPKHAEVAKSGELGWTWGLYEYGVAEPEAEAIKSAGKYLNIWRKQDDGSWRVMVDMGNTGI